MFLKVGSHKFNLRIYPNGRAKKHGKFAVLLVREPIYDTHDILFFKNPPNDSNSKKIIKSKPCYIGKYCIFSFLLIYLKMKKKNTNFASIRFS